jgi:hypothetical protein
MTHTAQDLLEAVGVDWTQRYALVACPECQMIMAYKGIPQHGLDCRRPSTRDVEPTYTGPALGTPELDAILWVEGQQWLISGDVTFETLAQIARNVRGGAYTKTAMEALGYLLMLNQPGHALAAAIKEVAG